MAAETGTGTPAWATAKSGELKILATLTPGELPGQLLDPAFRRGKIVGGRSCHDRTPFPYLRRVTSGCPPWHRLTNEAVGMLRDVAAQWNVRTQGV
jgi:hypothetical protein